MEVILIRHTSVDVPKGTCYGWTDVPVRDTFPQEAALTRQQLETYGPVDAVYSSPLTRARKLAEYCLLHSTPDTQHSTPDIITDDRLKEMNMGDWEMQRYDDIKDPCLDEWYKDYMHLPTPNGEGFPQLYQRVASFLDELRTKTYRRVAVFAHGGVLICAGLYGGLFPADGAWNHLVPYGGLQHMTL